MQQSHRLPTIMEIVVIAAGIIGAIFLFVQVLALPIQLALITAWFIIIAMGKRDSATNKCRPVSVKGSATAWRPFWCWWR